MLNRRTLRIKVMQTLFAYKQRVKANYVLSEDYLKEVFSPDMNSMEIQDHEVLKDLKTESLKLLAESMKRKNGIESEDEEILENVNKAIQLYKDSNNSDVKQIRNQMIQDVDHLFSAYISFLELMIELQEQAILDTKRDHSNFVKNLLIKGLRLNKSLEKAILDNRSRWKDKIEVREWFRTMVSKDVKYLEYNEKKSTSFDDDYGVIKHLINKIIFKNEVIETFLEDSDLYWDENRPVIKSLVLKTVKSIDSDSPDEFDLQEVSYNYEEDKEFFVKLFDCALTLDDSELELIGEKATNWDIERLALIDKIVLEMAISELINFPSIPVKVTINEYIEVSKKYSTPKSKQFINGILDVIADELQENGRVRKSGRGLIDNK